MFKTRAFFLTCFCLSLAVLMGCSDTSNLEQALQVAESRNVEYATQVAELQIQEQQQLDDAATRSAEELNNIGTRSAEALVDAQNAAQESVAAAQGTTDAISALATADAAIIPDYDTSIYGIIDELNLNGVEVTFWHPYSGTREEALLEIVDQFNDDNSFGIIVNATNEGAIDNIAEKIVSGLSTGDLPSLATAPPYQAARFQLDNGLVDFNTYIEHSIYGFSDSDKSDFFTSFANSDQLPQFSGERYAFAIDREMELVYYNVDLLTELGFSGPPWTPAEFEAVACAATDATTGRVGLQFELTPSRMASLIFGQNGEIFDLEDNEFSYNTANGIASIELIQRLITAGCAIVVEESFGEQAAFAAQQTLFTLGSSSNIPFYESEVGAAEAPFSWSVSPLPYSGFEPVQNIFGLSFVVPRTTAEEQLAAWLFIQYFTSTDVQVDWVRTSNTFPVRVSTTSELDSFFDDNPAYALAFDLLRYGKTEPQIAGYEEVQLVAATTYEEIFAGEDVSVKLTELNSTANQIVANIN